MEFMDNIFSQHNYKFSLEGHTVFTLHSSYNDLAQCIKVWWIYFIIKKKSIDYCDCLYIVLWSAAFCFYKCMKYMTVQNVYWYCYY